MCDPRWVVTKYINGNRNQVSNVSQEGLYNLYVLKARIPTKFVDPKAIPMLFPMCMASNEGKN